MKYFILNGRQFAIKMLHSSLDYQAECESFLQEVSPLKYLSHPHILPIFEAGIYVKSPYLVTEYAPNGTLLQYHPKGATVPLVLVVQYIKQVAAALQYAHDQKLIHHHIKPENMLVGKNNDIFVADFGLSIMTRGSYSWEAHDIGGTSLYMSPESFRGKATYASDQYSLGIVVYEWLTGLLPFAAGDFMQVMDQHFRKPVPSLREKNPTISSLVEQVVMKALEKDPNQRFPCITEFATALEQAVQPVSVSLSGIITSIQAPMYADGNVDQPPQTIPIEDDSALPLQEVLDSKEVTEKSTVLVTSNELNHVQEQSVAANAIDELIGSAAANPMSDPKVSSAVNPTDKSIVPFNTTVKDQPLTSPLVEIKTNQTSSSWPTVTSRSSSQSIKEIVKQRSTTSIWTKHTHQEVYAVTWSPNGKFIASAGADKLIQRWEVSTGRKLADYHASSKVYALAWSPDEKYIASAGEDKIQIWNVATGKLRSYPARSEVYALAWSPDSTYIALGGSDRILRVWDVGRKREVFTFRGHTDWIRAVAWSPDRKYIASGSNDHTVRVWDFASRATTPIFTYTNHTDWVRTIAWTPNKTDNMCIASAGYDQTIQIWEATTGEMFLHTAHTTEWMGGVFAIAWSPDGKYIASAGEDQTIKLWNTTDGTCISTYKGHSAPVVALAWSPDGQKIVSGGYDKTVCIWQVINASDQKMGMDSIQAEKIAQ